MAGIVYADAIRPNFFNDEHVGIINRAWVGIALFIERKYRLPFPLRPLGLPVQGKDRRLTAEGGVLSM